MIIQFDIKTVLVSEIAVCLLFASVMSLMARHQQYIKGLRQLAISFLATAGGFSFFLMRSFFTHKIDVLISNSLYCVSNVLLYLGISSLLVVKTPRLRFPVLLAALSTIALSCILGEHYLTLRIEVMTIADLVLRAFVFNMLLRNLSRGPTVKLLASFVGIFILGDVARIIATYHYGGPADVFQYNATQSAYLALTLLANCAIGVFSLGLAAREMATSLERRAHVDSLTGVLNRFGIETLMASELTRAQRVGTPLSIAILDVDEFKAFNSRGGHALGDDVLRQVAACITRNLRDYDACGRIGGDEFVLLFPNVESSKADTICRRILQAIESLPDDATVGWVPTVSMGLTQANAADSVESMLARADRALYAAKRSGKNCVEIEPRRDAVAPSPMVNIV
ncbi:hypothetical protein BH10ACI4_BH10ACI4_11410 [soil metagenome]